ncbi:MAG: hypothetical protein K8W52_13360, partial [Deltaproteobacteria bacterium]|nr:hypothetical protein [Deltaproteobacteria bacterium]
MGWMEIVPVRRAIAILLSVAEGKPRALRAVARCSSLEEFIAGFARFAEAERLFIITPDPRPVGGPPQPFVIQLADGSTALRGVGEVIESHLIPTGPEGKCGMWLRLVELAPASVEVHRQLLEQRARITARLARMSTSPVAPVIAASVADVSGTTTIAPPVSAPSIASAPPIASASAPAPEPPTAMPPGPTATPASAPSPTSPPPLGDPSRGLAPLARLRPLPVPGGPVLAPTGPRVAADPTPLGAPRAPVKPVIEIPAIGPRGRGGTMVPPLAPDRAPAATA